MKTTYPIPVAIEGLQSFHSAEPFPLESGVVLPELEIGYHTYGRLNAAGDNVVWVCHALTANSEVLDWWSGLFGQGTVIDPEEHFIVCANILGSCYGTTGPRSIDPRTGEAYGLDFPVVTIRDLVRAHDRLRQYLGIEKINLCIGGSCGGHQVLEYALFQPDLIERMALVVTSARESAWSIAIHEAQRMILEADPTFVENTDKAGAVALRAARGNALLHYRTSEAYVNRQTDRDERLEHFSAGSYIRYQGEKLERRFYAHCYYQLLKSLDTHHLGRGRGGLEKTLQDIKIPALVIAIDTDRLIPKVEQLFLAKHLPMSTYRLIESKYGHDGFLIEVAQISRALQEWWT